MKKKNKKSTNTGLSTTIMTDVLFILLIFFVLVSTIKKDSIRIKATKVDKQKKSTSKKKMEKHIVTINNKNKIYVDGQEQKSNEGIKTILDAIKRNTPKDTEPLIILRPDALSNSSKLIEIFGILQEVGLDQNVQIEVESK